METREQSLTKLREILDRLGPGVSLTIDEPRLNALFGPAGEDRRKAVAHFAQSSDCAFIYDPQDKVGIFGRAYTKLSWPDWESEDWQQ